MCALIILSNSYNKLTWAVFNNNPITKDNNYIVTHEKQRHFIEGALSLDEAGTSGPCFLGLPSKPNLDNHLYYSFICSKIPCTLKLLKFVLVTEESLLNTAPKFSLAFSWWTIFLAFIVWLNHHTKAICHSTKDYLGATIYMQFKTLICFCIILL